MGNPYFRFKQFTVFHNLCAMKVGVDGVLLGAWAEAKRANDILDVGTGSGLIALMLAQRNSGAVIQAIDIEDSAVQQAKENINISPWKERIRVEGISFQDFAKTTNSRFDLIVSNPPYFINSLKSPESDRTKARHTNTLAHEELIIFSRQLLRESGKLCLILPIKEGEYVSLLAKKEGFFCTKRVEVFPKPGAEAKRVLLEFSLTKAACEEKALTIESSIRHQYTEDYSLLLKDFYLKL